jgi:glycosyltransferase involved in cell wall biosynthesis
MITVLIPAYNEEKRILLTFETLREAKEISEIQFETLVVDDGSKDKTNEVVLEAMHTFPDLRIIRLEENQGQGAALLFGIKNVTTKYFMIVPADNDLSVSGIIKLLEQVGKAGLIVGHYGKNLKRYLYRKVLSRSYSKLVCFFTGTSVEYINGPALYETNAVQKLDLHSKGFTFIAELTSKTIHQVSEFGEVVLETNPTTEIPGASLSVQTLKDSARMFVRFGIGIDRKLKFTKSAKRIVIE